MSSGIVKRSPRVDQDIITIAEYISRDSLPQALRFLDAAERSCADLARNPMLGAVSQFRSKALADTRVWRVQDFPNYLIFYKPITNGIRVLRVLHGARKL